MHGNIPPFHGLIIGEAIDSCHLQHLIPCKTRLLTKSLQHPTHKSSLIFTILVVLVPVSCFSLTLSRRRQNSLNRKMMSILALITGKTGPSGFGSASTADQVTDGINANNLTAIVTGGASGIGLETSRVLALRGVHVVIGARNSKAANEAKETILKDNGSARIDVLKLDLCSIKSVNEFVKNFNALDVPLNILINNAGIMFCPYQLSEDGIEIQFATNHLGHFHLTNLLLGNMRNTASSTGIQGRIVNLSSIAHVHTYDGGIRFDKLNDKKEYSDKKAYGQSKLANLLHANELSRRLQEEGANITVNSVHPGLIMTNLFQYSGFAIRSLKLLTFLLWKNVPQGAATTCYAALHPSMKDVTGKYYLDCNEMKPSKYARNEILAKQLWDFSNKLIKSIELS